MLSSASSVKPKAKLWTYVGKGEAKTSEPSHFVKPGQEQEWEKAKQLALKMKNVDDYWAAVTGIFKKLTHQEADASSAFPQLTRAAKPKKQTQAIKVDRMRIRETADQAGQKKGLRFDTVMLQEGLGNLKSLFYYPKAALESAVPIFEGKKIYADHPTAEEEAIRPERSTRDVLGHWENVRVENNGDRAQLVGDAVFVDSDDTKWARARMQHALEYSKKYPDKDFIGLSINADGEHNPMPIDEAMSQCQSDDIKSKLEEAKNQGATEVNMVSAFDQATSCDMVTDAGAGGKVTKLLEGEKNVGKKISKTKENVEGDPNAGHDDVEQDKALLVQMLHKYGLIDGDQENEMHQDGDGDHDGDDGDHKNPHADGHAGGDGTGNPPHKVPGQSQADMVHETHQMYQAYQAMGGMTKEEAMSHAVHHQRLKQKMAQTEAVEAEKKHQAESENENVESETEKKQSEKKENEKKESAAMKELAKLSGQVAMLEAQLKSRDVESYIEKRCKESKLPHAVTKKLRESCNKAKVKSTKEVDTIIDNFMEGFKEAQTNETHIFPEKSNYHSEVRGGAPDFSKHADSTEEE